jgi:hypothetical protein
MNPFMYSMLFLGSSVVYVSLNLHHASFGKGIEKCIITDVLQDTKFLLGTTSLQMKDFFPLRDSWHN